MSSASLPKTSATAASGESSGKPRPSSTRPGRGCGRRWRRCSRGRSRAAVYGSAKLLRAQLLAILTSMELGVATFADLSSGISPEQRMRNLMEEVRAGRPARPRRLRHRRASPRGLPDLLAGHPAGRRGRHHRAHPALERGHRPQLRRPGPRLPGLRRGRPAVGRSRRDHGRARLVHRVLPALRLRPQGLRRALRGEARPAAAHPRRRARHLGRAPPRPARRRGRVAAARPGPAARVGRGRRLAAVRGAGRDARPAARARDHRRPARALRAARRPLPRGGARRRPRRRADARGHQHPRLRRRDLRSRPTPPSPRRTWR